MYKNIDVLQNTVCVIEVPRATDRDAVCIECIYLGTSIGMLGYDFEEVFSGSAEYAVRACDGYIVR